MDTSLGHTHLVAAGAGDPVCVFLPETNFNAATSLGLLAALARRCTVVAADLPGQPGLSSSTRPRPEAEGYGTWLGELLDVVRDRHRPGRLVVVAHSRGAAVALAHGPALRLAAAADVRLGRSGPAVVSWMTLVARDTRSTGAPGPLPGVDVLDGLGTSRSRRRRSAWSTTSRCSVREHMAGFRRPRQPFAH